MDWFDHLSEYNTIQDMPSASINDVSKQSCGILKRKLNHPKSRRTQKAHRKIFSRGDIPIVKGKLYLNFLQDSNSEVNIDDLHHSAQSKKMNDPNKICEVSIDEWFDYPSLINYHGPSSIINILSFINLVDQAVASEKILRLIVNKGSFQALNAVFLATAYKLIKFGSQNLKNKQLSEPNAISRRAKIFSRQVEPIVKLLRPRVYKTEGSQPAGIHDPSITINDCLEGLQTFIFQLNLINLKNLDIYQMSKLESAEGGDMNWIIPDKILAFAGPSKDRMTVEQLRNYCLENNVDSIFRLNVDADYDENILHQSNINHHDIAIRDGGIPTRDQIEHFINLVDKLWTQNKAFGVHCWAGLGRTGTMIAAFLIRKFRLRAAPVIAFLRLMRPGSVLSVQGHFLHHIEAYLRMEVSEYSSFDKFMNDE